MDVLIVDDDPNIRKVYARLLEREGYQVTHASDGSEAMLNVQLREYHAIVCDVQMQFQQGTEFYTWLKEEHPAMARKVIFVTGVADDPQVRAMLETTGRPFLPKPVDASTLVRVINNLAGRRPS